MVNEALIKDVMAVWAAVTATSLAFAVIPEPAPTDNTVPPPPARPAPATEVANASASIPPSLTDIVTAPDPLKVVPELSAIVALSTVKSFGTFSTDKVSDDNSKVEASAALVFNIVPSTESAAIVNAPPDATVASPLTKAKAP